MRNESERAERFKEICTKSVFTYREKVLNELGNSEYTLNSRNKSAVPAKDVLNIYNGRAQRLSKYTGTHAIRLRNEVVALCRELEKYPNDLIEVLSFSDGETSDYVLFCNSHRILGCLLTVDRRKVTDKHWEELWGNK